LIALIQRVSEASVSVEGEVVGEIRGGILALIGVEKNDSENEAARLAQKILAYRVFPDNAGKMNLSLHDVGGALLAVPQFTLVAETNSGTRPSFSAGASPEQGKQLFESFLNFSKAKASGRFGAHMEVRLVNDGPVTFWLRVAPPTSS
jgi:D-aminoacyl-tRNA deacylase